MFIADEILKFLVCEVCFKNFNDKDRLPYVLTPCGHTFCDNCIGSFRSNMCAACNTKFDSRIKNWALINLVPRARLVDDYEQIKQRLESAKKDQQTYKDHVAERDGAYKRLFDLIRRQIDQRAADLIARVNECHGLMLNQLGDVEAQWSAEMTSGVEYETKLVETLKHFEATIELEEIKTDEIAFGEMKNSLTPHLNELDERLNQERASPDDYVVYRMSNLDAVSGLDVPSLFGELVPCEANKLDEEFQKPDNSVYSEILDRSKLSEAPMAEMDQTSTPVPSEPAVAINKTPTYPVLQSVPSKTSIARPTYPYPGTESQLQSQQSQSALVNLAQSERQNINIYPSGVFNTPATAEENNSNSSNSKSESSGKSSLKKSSKSGSEKSNSSSLLTIKLDDQPAPRLCYLTRSNNQEYYGFDLKSSKTSGKHTVSNIKQESVAYRAGLRNDDFVLEINGAPVEGLPRDQVVAKILQNPKQLEILVLTQVDKQSLDSLKVQKQVAKPAASEPTATKPRTTSLISETSSDFDASFLRTTQLNKNANQSFGFAIDKKDAGPPIISNIDKDSPAHLANLKEGDLIIRLNGIDLTDKSFAKILEIARKEVEKSNTIELQTIEANTFLNAKNIGRNRSSSVSDPNKQNSEDSHKLNDDEDHKLNSTKHKSKIAAMFRKTNKKKF